MANGETETRGSPKIRYGALGARICPLAPRFYTDPPSPEGFRLPGGALVPALATAASLAVIAGADWGSLGAGGVALAMGVLFYVLPPLLQRARK